MDFRLDDNLTVVNGARFDNRLMAQFTRVDYCRSMGEQDFRQRVLAVMCERGINKADLSRMSGIKYHTLDKFLKGTNRTTSSENAVRIAQALGIKADDDRQYEEPRSLYFQLDEQQQMFLINAAKGLLTR